MSKLIDSKVFNTLLLLTIVGEFLIPFLLKHFYAGYNSKLMVMSALGSPESPVRKIYNTWLIWLGCFLLLTAYVLFIQAKEVSLSLAVLQCLSISIFAIGAGILSGLFSVNESKDVVTLASQIHGFGAAIGFMFLLFFPLINGLLAFKMYHKVQGTLCLIAFISALICFICFILGDKDALKETIFAYEGLWERLTLFMMYIPFLYTSITKLATRTSTFPN